MNSAKHIGRVGALAVALGVMATVVAAPTASASAPNPPYRPCTDTRTTCGLILGTSGVPTPDDFYVESVKNQFIAPTHPGHIEYVKVTTPEELWPVGLVNRFVSLLGIGLGDPEIFGLDGAEWDVPGWGLFDRSLDQSVQAGVADLERAIAAHPNEHLVIFGYSQSALIANREKRKLAEQYPKGTTAPDIDFVLGGDPNLPNGGFFARFPGLYIPILDWTLNGPAPTDTQFDTVEIIHEYDFMADFPLYPLNGISLLNAVLGFVYVHLYPFDVSLAPDPTTPPPIHSKTGDTDYYFFETPDLPLFAPLRTLGVPEQLIDVVEPFFKEIVDLGYDRRIPPGEPTPARLIPPLNPETVTADLVNAIGEGITNAAALLGAPKPLSIRAAPAHADLDAVESQLLQPRAVIEDDTAQGQRQVVRDLAATRDHIDNTIGAVKSVIGNGRTIARSAGSDNDSPTASPTRKTPLRDAVATARADVKKVVTQVSDNVKKALGGDQDKANTRPEGGAGAAP